MPYKRSRARQSATLRIDTLRSSFVYAKIRTRQLPTPVRDCIFQNCVFQLSAILEDYLSEATNSWFSALAIGGADNSAIPLSTRALYAARSQEDAYKRYFGLGDESDLARRIAEQISLFQLFDNGRRMAIQDYHGKLVKDRKFPSVYNIDTIFRRLGLPKIFRALSRRTRTDVELALRAFMDVRNALAHESPPSITDADVERYFRQVRSWIDAIDREFYSHVLRSSGAAFWD